MQSNKKIIELGKKLPHGAKKKIAKTTGLSYNTVVSYFNGNPVSIYSESLILNEVKIVLEIVAKADQARNELLRYFTK